jgi:hypothetical protein
MKGKVVMSTRAQNFNLQFAQGDECYAVLTGLDRAKDAAQFCMEQMAAFSERFDRLRRNMGMTKDTVTIEHMALVDGLADSYLFDCLIYWLDEVIEEDIVEGEIVHPAGYVEEAVVALQKMQHGAQSVTMSEEASWEIQEVSELVEVLEKDKFEAASAVLERAQALLPRNACYHGVEGHDHSGLQTVTPRGNA